MGYKEYYAQNKEKVLARVQAYNASEKGKEVMRIAGNKYKKLNRVKINQYEKNRREIPEVKIARNLRIRLSIALKSQQTRKHNKTMQYVGCSKEQLKNHLESLFLEDMNWGNYGLWHIDHIVPISSFDLSVESNLFIAMNYKNLQPLWAQDNYSKGAIVL